jgi:hypothetical protein
MGWRVLGAVGVLWLTGCVQDPLAEHSVYWGLSPFERPSGPLVRVLDFDSATPDKQGLLYTSMRDAEVAATYAGRALARTNEPGETGTALGQVVYAIEPAEAPAWDTRHYPFGPVWAGHGYGLQPALNDMASELAGVSEGASASAPLREHGQSALRCTENTRARAGQVLTLSHQALAASGGVAPAPALERIKEQAEALNRGVESAGASGCGLQEVKRQLDQVALAAPSG